MTPDVSKTREYQLHAESGGFVDLNDNNGLIVLRVTTYSVENEAEVALCPEELSDLRDEINSLLGY